MNKYMAFNSRPDIIHGRLHVKQFTSVKQMFLPQQNNNYKNINRTLDVLIMAPSKVKICQKLEGICP